MAGKGILMRSIGYGWLMSAYGNLRLHSIGTC
uniref:Uncharacterized protein n=1 Tax=Siphoviridae sp. cteNz1 TaxID=2826404 RepID=A0A8S5N7C4_9CAUD|nr:MAG TPA: hypothetical protein [Siphoviridae sp. cteNz1]